MRTGFQFLVITGILIGCVLPLPGPYYILLWPAFSFSVVGMAYLGYGARVFGKQQDGQLAWPILILLFPYLVFMYVIWHLQRVLSREPCWNEIAPGMYLGRRAFNHELPEGIDLVVDLTTEFAEPIAVVSGREYRCLPILDNAVPAEADFLTLIETIRIHSGRVYVHCALGHGRSAMVAAAVLMARAIAAGVDEAETLIKQRRPRVRLHWSQRAMLKLLAKRIIPADGMAANLAHAASLNA